MEDIERLNRKLIHAAINTSVNEVKKYLHLGADVNCTYVDSGDTALQLACCCNRVDIVQMLLEYGCNLNHRNKQGKTALHCAAEFATTDIIKVLIEYGCKPDQIDNSGKTALLYAAHFGNADTINVLLEHGCKPDQKDNLVIQVTYKNKKVDATGG
ncbi:ankyrin repeat domain-containing protein 50-like [Mytilus californianus]|uniref:ankyrin repeat domain-containing protein 50-like n=1 Tax=Mytilus californianus TaxID=6549 RepID=UPI002247548F|nr:ankyrin repeat domain-containing protein 50-like [Mytilus californianus]